LIVYGVDWKRWQASQFQQVGSEALLMAPFWTATRWHANIRPAAQCGSASTCRGSSPWQFVVGPGQTSRRGPGLRHANQTLWPRLGRSASSPFPHVPLTPPRLL